jgi:hypothetical protein
VDEQGYVQGTLMIVAGACVCMCVSESFNDHSTQSRIKHRR